MFSQPAPQRFFGLTTSEQRRVLRPGDTLALQLRLRNERAAATPPATLAFLASPEWTVLDAPTTIASLGPGEVLDVQVSARVERVAATATQTWLQAVLGANGDVFGSNLVHVRVAGEAQLRREVTLACVGNDVDVTLTVKNDGDAPAIDLNAELPVPPGFSHDDVVLRATCEMLEPQASWSSRWTCTPREGDNAVVRVPAGTLIAHGRVHRIEASAPIIRPAYVQIIDAQAQAIGVFAHLDVRLENGTNALAADTVLTVALAAGWSAVARACVVDGQTARPRRVAQGVEIPLGALLGRSQCHVTLLVQRKGEAAAEPLVVRCGSEERAVPLATMAPHAPRLNLSLRDPLVHAGGTVLLGYRIAGADAAPQGVEFDLPEGRRTVTITPDEHGAAQGEYAVDIAPGSEPGRYPIAARWLGAHGDVRSHAHIDVHVAAQPEAPEPETLPVTPSAGPALPAAPTMMLHAPDHIARGQVFGLRLQIVLETDCSHLTVVVTAPGLTYVVGSTIIDGHHIVDRLTGDGVGGGERFDCYDLAAGVPMTIEWSALAHRLEPHCTLVVTADADGGVAAEASHTIAIEDRALFNARPSSLGIHLDAAVAAPTASADVEPLSMSPPIEIAADREPVTEVRVGYPLDAPAREQVARLLGGARGPGLVSHLATLFVLPQLDLGPSAANAAEARDRASVELLERLFIKARIPGYAISPFDWDDHHVRDALAAVLHACAMKGEAVAPLEADVWAHVDRRVAGALYDAIDRAQLGDAQTLLALAALLPTHPALPDLAPLTTYCAGLAETLAACLADATDDLTERLEQHPSGHLDRLRAAAVQSLARAVAA